MIVVQEALELVSCRIPADCAEQFRGHLEGGEIAGDIGRAAGHKALTLEINDRYRRLGRNARHAAPDKVVQHRVPHHQDPGPACASQDPPRGRRW